MKRTLRYLSLNAQAIGIAFSMGTFIGYLVARRCSL